MLHNFLQSEFQLEATTNIFNNETNLKYWHLLFFFFFLRYIHNKKISPIFSSTIFLLKAAISFNSLFEKIKKCFNIMLYSLAVMQKRSTILQKDIQHTRSQPTAIFSSLLKLSTEHAHYCRQVSIQHFAFSLII